MVMRKKRWYNIIILKVDEGMIACLNSIPNDNAI